MSGTEDKKKRKRAEAVSRRDFLRVGSLSVVGLSVAEKAALARLRAAGDTRSCIYIMMTGGPSQFETFDPKPDATSEIRGPMKAISTAIPGIAISESLPMLAQRAEQFSLLRSLTHSAAPIHETGYQLLQTGRLAYDGVHYPHFGSVVAKIYGARERVPPSVVLPELLSATGVKSYRGQGAGFLGDEYEPITPLLDGQTENESETMLVGNTGWEAESETVRRAYGDNRFGRLCLQARQMVEAGVRCITVNLFDRLDNEVTWDCHASTPHAPATLYDYRDQLCPQFDRAMSALLDDLTQRGLLNQTMVVATGEFGRTHRINEHCGRDHWPGVWSGLVAGGGVRGGQVIGASDPMGCDPIDRPIAPGELLATIYKSLGVDLATTIANGDSEIPIIEHAAIDELFG